MRPDQEKAKLRAEIMLAFSEGQDIEVLNNGHWRPVIYPSWPAWDWSRYDYRIKPQPREPRVVYLNELRNGDIDHTAAFCPEWAATNKESGMKMIKFIEVIEEEQP